MSTSETVQRHLATETNISTDRLRRGRVTDTDWPKLMEAGARAHHSRLRLLDDPAVTPSQLRAQARAISVREGGLGLVIVDYLRSCAPTHRLATASRRLLALSRA
jgi:replicative DNA helicase